MTQVLDFWHVTEHINQAAVALHRGKDARQEWIDNACHDLKHKHGAALEILGQLQGARENKLGAETRKELEAAITYFENNLGRMNYASYRKSHLPIGSGVTEAACKTIVKQRMCGSGMKWKHSGANDVLTLRAVMYRRCLGDILDSPRQIWCLQTQKGEEIAITQILLLYIQLRSHP
ncbi:MAG: hypothetical protein R3F19_24785 [Verrucomicrobiales bacterium]